MGRHLGRTPIVAGVAALIRSKWPDMSASQVINRIVSTAKDAGLPGKDPLYGFGVLNAEAALKADVPETKANPLGTISDWIRVHRRGNPVSSAAPAAPAPSSAAPTLPEPTVPVAAAPSPADSAVPAMVVLGFGGLFVCIIAAAAIQLRRALHGPGSGSEADAGAMPEVAPEHLRLRPVQHLNGPGRSARPAFPKHAGFRGNPGLGELVKFFTNYGILDPWHPPLSSRTVPGYSSSAAGTSACT